MTIETEPVTLDLRFRDADLSGHVNHMVDLTRLEEAPNRWMRAHRTGPRPEPEGLIATLTIQYAAELAVDDGPVRAEVALPRVGTQRIDTGDTQRNRSGEVVASVQVTLVAWDPSRRPSRQLNEQERTAAAELRVTDAKSEATA